MRNWIRNYKITCGQPGKPGFSTSDLRIEFSIKKTEKESANESTITLWNLNGEHENVCHEKDCFVELQAGYRDEALTTIFKGYVTYGETQHDGADKKTVMEVKDGSKEIRDSYTSKSYSGKTSNRQVIEDAAKDMNLDVIFADDCEYGNMPNGYSFVGKTTQTIQKACDVSGLHWFIDNGVLHIKNNQGTMNRVGYVLNSNSGLIGYPVKMTESGKSEGDKKVTGWTVEYFLNADIKCGDYVKLESDEANGFFRVESIEMSGDNFGGDWICKATLKIDEPKESTAGTSSGQVVQKKEEVDEHEGEVWVQDELPEDYVGPPNGHYEKPEPASKAPTFTPQELTKLGQVNAPLNVSASVNPLGVTTIAPG